jgi:hypothetical protein
MCRKWSAPSFDWQKTEIGEEVAKAKGAGILLGMGAFCGFFAVLFALLAAMLGLRNVMPEWAAALIVRRPCWNSSGVDALFRPEETPASSPDTRSYGRDRERECPVGDTTNQIESPIEKTREDLGANPYELERKVGEITDWRYHFRKHPMSLLGAAFGGGILLATMVTPRGNGSAAGPMFATASPHRHKVVETWDRIKDALLGVAATRVTDFVGELVPGFEQEFRGGGRTQG